MGWTMTGGADIPEGLTLAPAIYQRAAAVLSGRGDVDVFFGLPMTIGAAGSYSLSETRRGRIILDPAHTNSGLFLWYFLHEAAHAADVLLHDNLLPVTYAPHVFDLPADYHLDKPCEAFANTLSRFWERLAINLTASYVCNQLKLEALTELYEARPEQRELVINNVRMEVEHGKDREKFG